MKDKIIDFITADQAANRGFNAKCSHAYNNLGELVKCKGRNSEFHTLVAACSQSLLQKWLREVHKIDISVVPTKSEGYFASVSWVRDEIFNNFDIDSGFETYEQSLEKGLQESLKLIKL